MKKRLLIITFVFFMFTFLLDANAANAYINGDTVRIRENAGTGSSIITALNTGTDIDVLDKNKVSASGCSDGWYKISYNNKTGYVCSKYVTFYTDVYTGINVVDWSARVNSNNVSVRSGASTSYSALNTLTLGANVNIVDEVNGSSNSCSSGKWYKVTYYNDNTGYICANYVTKKSEITDNNIDNDYKEYLKNEGFPESYYPYLNYLHKKHPNWVFKAGITDLDFSASVSGENGKCYMQTTNDNYRTSSTPAEGSSWFKVNTGVIAFYMDPRNWFNENRLFMFESLNYDTSLESNYNELVKSIFGNGKLSDDAYTTPIVNAGKTNGISPVYIASRIRQEVGVNGSGSTSGGSFTWKGQTYSGYYNFFNIGAYEVTIDGVSYSAVTRGLAYAAKLIDRSGELWNNIDTALTEGSSFLSNGYVSKGQGTGYYQKFNVSKNAYYSKYTHQYMTNIQAPATEASSAYNSYNNADLLSQPFIFEIPVYKNMPAYTSLPNSGDNINTLSNLEVENYSLSPSFDEDILSYEVFVPENVNKINIKATLASSKASIIGTGEHEIDDDENMFTVTVTSENGNVNKYTITIIRSKNNSQNNSVNDIISKTNTAVINNTIAKISSGSKVSEYKNIFIKNGASNVTITNGNSTLSENQKIVTGSTLQIIVANETKSYTISINGDTSGDGEITILDLLQIQKHLTNSSKLAGAKYYAADTSGDNDVTILDLLQVQKYLKGEKSL